MKHTHVIEAENASAFKNQVGALYQELYGGTAHEPRPALEKLKAALEEKVAQEEEKKEEPAKRGRKPKEEVNAAPVVAAEPADDDVFGESKPAPVPYTQEDCAKRLQAVVSAKDIKKAKEILARFNAAKLVDLKPDQYSAFIGACDEVTP